MRGRAYSRAGHQVCPGVCPRVSDYLNSTSIKGLPSSRASRSSSRPSFFMMPDSTWRRSAISTMGLARAESSAWMLSLR